MFGFRLKNYQWVHVVLAGGSVGLTGCTDRVYQLEWVTDTAGGTAGTDTDGPDPTDTDNPDPTNPDPTSDPPPGIPGPPQLIDVRFLNNLTLQLTFNEPMSVPSAVDPTAFRLSVGFGSDYEPQKYYGYKWTNYLDLRYFNGPEVCNEYCWKYCYDPENPDCYDRYYCYEYCYSMPGNPVHSLSLALDGADPTKILLGLDNGIGSGVCAAVSQGSEFYIQALFLHFTDGFGPLTDEAGEGLLPIAEHWSLSPQQDFAYRQNEFFPDMNPFLPIPCPF